MWPSWQPRIAMATPCLFFLSHSSVHRIHHTELSLFSSFFMFVPYFLRLRDLEARISFYLMYALVVWISVCDRVSISFLQVPVECLPPLPVFTSTFFSQYLHWWQSRQGWPSYLLVLTSPDTVRKQLDLSPQLFSNLYSGTLPLSLLDLDIHILILLL